MKSTIGRGINSFFSSKLSQDKKLDSLDSLDTDSINGAKVLLVEDNLINQDVAVAMLAQGNIETKVAENGKQALEMLDKEVFDCVLMDIQMPIMDGYTAIKIIREDVRFKTLPILAMTANALASDEKLSVEAGMNCHISKPIDVICLFRELIRWIDLDKRNQATDDSTLLDTSAALERVGTNKGL